MKKIFIQTLGCKVNQFESASFQTKFEDKGCTIVGNDTESDIIIVNTCSVTGKAGSQSRNAVRRAARENPNAKIIVTGCYAQLAADEIEKIEELQDRTFSVVGNEKKDVLVDNALSVTTENVPSPPPHILDQKEICNLPVRHFKGRTRAYLKVQDGCDSYCSYCIVPYTRGHSRSLRIAEIIKQALMFQAEGHKEIVITGIHVGLYGNDLDEGFNISGLMQKLCTTTPDLRYRLSSIEPTEITDHLLQVMVENDNFMPHLHIPLQSGNDEILLRMNRRYTTGQFTDVLDLCRKKIVDIAIGIDILAGFPGEQEEHFNDSYSFLEEMDYTYLHVFPYSKRPGTPAASYDNQVPKHVKDERVRFLRNIGDLKKKEYYSRFFGTTHPVLVEGKRDRNGLLKGFTDNYIPVCFQGNDELKNCVINIRLDKFEGTKVIGQHVQGDG